VAGERARFFTQSQDLEEILYSLEQNPLQLLEMEEGSRQRHREEFEKEKVLATYEKLLLRALGYYS